MMLFFTGNIRIRPIHASFDGLFNAFFIGKINGPPLPFSNCTVEETGFFGSPPVLSRILSPKEDIS